VTGGRSPDVVVVGGGAVGVATAYELARRGAAVTVLERGGRLASGCSYGSAGLICPSHAGPLATPANLREGLRRMWKRDSPFILAPRPAAVPWLVRFALAATPQRAHDATRVLRALGDASLELHARYAASGLPTGFRRTGILYTYETPLRFEAARRDAAEPHGGEGTPVPQVLDGDEARRLVPSLGRAVVGAVFAPSEAYCDSRGFVDAVGDAVLAWGGTVETEVEVLRLRTEGRRIAAVETTKGDFTGRTVVLAAGVWARRLAGPLGIPLALEGGKGYHVDLEAAAGDPEIPVYMQEARVIATPLGRCLRLAGTLELAGLDASIDEVRINAVRAAAVRNLDGLTCRSAVEVWSGLRPCSADGLPIVGYAGGVENLVLATGHGMLGVALAPITGQLIGQLLSGEPPAYELRSFSPDRFRILRPAS
jgi:D-amino-acid dehydrogenase